MPSLSEWIAKHSVTKNDIQHHDNNLNSPKYGVKKKNYLLQYHIKIPEMSNCIAHTPPLVFESHVKSS